MEESTAIYGIELPISNRIGAFNELKSREGESVPGLRRTTSPLLHRFHLQEKTAQAQPRIIMWPCSNKEAHVRLFHFFVSSLG